MDSAHAERFVRARSINCCSLKLRCASSVFTPTAREWELIRLPDALLFLYYPIRFARVAAMRLRSLFVRR